MIGANFSLSPREVQVMKVDRKKCEEMGAGFYVFFLYFSDAFYSLRRLKEFSFSILSFHLKLENVFYLQSTYPTFLSLTNESYQVRFLSSQIWTLVQMLMNSNNGIYGYCFVKVSILFVVFLGQGMKEYFLFKLTMPSYELSQFHLSLYIYIYIYTGWNDKIVFLKKTTLQLYFKTFIEKKSIQVTWLCSRADIYSM